MYELVIVITCYLTLGKAHGNSISPSLKRKNHRKREQRDALACQRPPLWSGLRANTGLPWGCPQHCGTSPSWATQIWAHALCPCNWGVLFMPFPREHNHSSPWLKGSNFKHRVLSRQILTTSKTHALKKDDQVQRTEERKQIFPPSLSLFPQTPVSTCPSCAERGGRQVSVL